MKIFKRLFESKADKQKLIDYVGEQTAKDFFSLKPRMKSPYNDLYYWMKREPQELKDYIDKLNATQTRSQKDDTAKEGAELLYSDADWKVYHITSYEASVKYGKNTQWCISGSKRWSDSTEGGKVFWNQYREKGIEFYFYIYQGKEKYAVALYPNKSTYEIFNETDDAINFIPNNAPQIEGLPKGIVIDPFANLDEDGTYYYKGGIISEDLHGYINKVIIDNSIKEISDNAFFECEDIEEITIPNNIIAIGNYAFYGCENLKSINIPDSVKSIGEEAFYGCVSINSVNLPKELTEIKMGTFFGCGRLTNINIPDGVTLIGDSAFGNCSSITNINIPDGVTSIGNGVFEYCSNLKGINIPDSVTSIGRGVFSNCSSLANINIPNSITNISNSIFIGCNSLKSINIPSSVTSIGDFAFSDCSNLTNVIIPNSVRNIGYQAFSFSRNLKSVTIPNSVKSIGDAVFMNSYDITILTPKGSYADQYAQKNNIPVKYINTNESFKKHKKLNIIKENRNKCNRRRYVLIESKADIQRLVAFAGEDTANLFFKLKPRLKSPYNDLYYWLKQSPDDLKNYLEKSIG